MNRRSFVLEDLPDDVAPVTQSGPYLATIITVILIVAF